MDNDAWVFFISAVLIVGALVLFIMFMPYVSVLIWQLLNT